MKQIQRGFTLIELVMVIIILGILAAVAIPKYFDVKSDAETAVGAYTTGAGKEESTTKAACLSITPIPPDCQ